MTLVMKQAAGRGPRGQFLWCTCLAETCPCPRPLTGLSWADPRVVKCLPEAGSTQRRWRSFQGCAPWGPTQPPWKGALTFHQEVCLHVQGSLCLAKGGAPCVHTQLHGGRIPLLEACQQFCFPHTRQLAYLQGHIRDPHCRPPHIYPHIISYTHCRPPHIISNN